MSQKKTNANDATMSVIVTYYSLGINADGIACEQKNEKKEVKLYKLSRRNPEHAKFALNLIKNAYDDMEAATEYVRIFCIDDAQRHDLLGDHLACIEVFNMKEVGEELQRFLESWDLFKMIEKEK